ncbi:MAG: hypothetical protein CM15mP93_14060 [Thiotrichaceae bacterium]|nr:MAG: hypothetical protein CM15mP93_14060 [Thiotrichaceae bacterium]
MDGTGLILEAYEKHINFSKSGNFQISKGNDNIINITIFWGKNNPNKFSSKWIKVS